MIEDKIDIFNKSLSIKQIIFSLFFPTRLRSGSKDYVKCLLISNLSFSRRSSIMSADRSLSYHLNLWTVIHYVFQIVLSGSCVKQLWVQYFREDRPFEFRISSLSSQFFMKASRFFLLEIQQSYIIFKFPLNADSYLFSYLIVVNQIF